jgi:anthranilate synthase/indole-3-glycerol phosphate synthase/phosphoribosylanthranilate isomerase
VYAGLNQDIPITRYHSLAGTHADMPACLEVSSWITRPDGTRGVIQGVRHKEYAIEGVQFHPESILSEGGRIMIRNFLRLTSGTWEENSEASPSKSATLTNGASPPAAAPSNILQKIYASRKKAVDAQKLIPSLRPADLQATYDLGGAPPLVPLVARLRQSPFDVSLMAEIKRASPSKGVFDLAVSAPAQARRYALAGASVISVLTEPEWFRGGIDDVRAVRQVLNNMPNRPAILRKEFVFDEYQILEARLAGADTVLLIVKMLDDALLAHLYCYSLSLGMEPLVEVQNADEMVRAVALGARVIGVNNRNLESFEVDIGTTGRLRGQVPPGTIICALSGINSSADVDMCRRDGVDAVLVGEAIMRAPDAGVFIQQLCGKTNDDGVNSAMPAPTSSPAKLLVKVCGTRTAEAAAAAAEAGADLVGMILVPAAKRFVPHDTALAISAAVRGARRDAPSDASPSSSSPSPPPPSRASDYFAHPPLPAHRPLLVGVFQNQPLADVLALQRAYALDVVQLHGSEPLEWASLIPVPVIRAFKPHDHDLAARGYHALPVLDSGAGSGTLLSPEAVRVPLRRDPGLHVILAGGLGPDNVKQTIDLLGDDISPRVLGVDASSGLEEGGVQSIDKIRRFIAAAKAVR